MVNYSTTSTGDKEKKEKANERAAAKEKINLDKTRMSSRERDGMTQAITNNNNNIIIVVVVAMIDGNLIASLTFSTLSTLDLCQTKLLVGITKSDIPSTFGGEDRTTGRAKRLLPTAHGKVAVEMSREDRLWRGTSNTNAIVITWRKSGKDNNNKFSKHKHTRGRRRCVRVR